MITVYKDGPDFYWICIDNHEILGDFKLSTSVLSGMYWWLSEFKIYERHRNKGYGQEAIKEIFKLDCVKDKQIYLTVNRENLRAIHIYEKLGFKFLYKSIAIKTDDIYVYNNRE